MTSEANPHYFATTTKDDTSIDQITDSLDFPHTGLIKTLSLGMKGNYALKGSATDFDITQAGSGNVVQVAAGKIYRDNAFLAVAAKNFVAGDFQATSSTYHLLVADSASPPVLQIRKHGSSTQSKVPEYTEGDTIIAVLTYTSDGFNDMTVQYLTTGKVSNNVSIGYDSSGYTEGLSITTNAGDTTFENKVADKDIIFKVNDGGTAREMLRLDADDNEVRIVSTIDSTGIGPQLTLFRDTPDASDNDNIGVISLKGEDSGNTETEYVRIQGQILDETNTDEDAQLFIRTLKAGSLAYNLKFTPSTTIFNANNDDIDIRIDGDTNDSIFTVDAGTEVTNIRSLSVGTAGELTITESSDDISFTNTVNDKTLKFIVNDGSGNDKTATLTAATTGDVLQLKGIEEILIIALSDETTDLTTGTDKIIFHMPFAMTLTGVKASVSEAPTGSTIIVDINEFPSGGSKATILSTKLSIDASEMSSLSAATAAVISDTALADNATLHFDIDQIGSSNAGKGLKVTLYGYRT
jgi:hypothetical protein